MKKICLFFVLLFVISSLASCGEEKTYTPEFTLSEEFTLSGETIRGTVVGRKMLKVSDFLLTSDAITIFADSTGDRYVQGLDAEIPLSEGENKMVLRFFNGAQEKEYVLQITCVAIRSFSVSILNPERTYHIGEAFDPSTVRVTAVTEEGTEIEISKYQAEYEFSMPGKNTVGIEIGGFYQSFSVMVTEEYRPVLDASLSADGICYALENGEAILTDGTSAERFFAVPTVVIAEGKEYPVTKIAPMAFGGAWLTGVQIPSSVKEIGDEAFSGCLALEWVEMPDQMEKIGAFAFSGCESLESVSVPEGIFVLGDGVFRECASLRSVSLPSDLEHIGVRAFFGCKFLESVNFPRGLREIEESAFEGCEAFSTVVVENLSKLGDRAFAACKALSVFAAGEVNAVGEGVFSGCEKVTVYVREGHVLAETGPKTVTVRENEPYIVSLPTEFAIEDGYPYEETLILCLSENGMRALSDYRVSYPADACGYLDVTLTEDTFTHTFSVFVSYTEDVTFGADTRGVLYELDAASGRAKLLSAPIWVKKSSIYVPETEGLFLVPTTLWCEGKMYVVTEIAEDAFAEAENIASVFVPVLEKKP